MFEHRPWCFLNHLRISSKSQPKVERNPEEGLNEDEDVQMEKARVKEALTCQSCEEVSDVYLTISSFGTLVWESKELLNLVSVV